MVDPQTADGTDDPGALGVTVTLSGRVPPDATSFRRASDLTFATYALSVASAAHATAEIVWLDGGEQSRPLALVRLPAPPTRRQVAGVALIGLFWTHGVEADERDGGGPAGVRVLPHPPQRR